MAKLTLIGASVLGSTLLLVGFSSRSLSEFFGYARATADTTVSHMEDSVPTEIRDQKLRNDIDQARSDIIDRRVQLNLATTEIRRMQDDIQQLQGKISRREVILAEAYPALQSAAEDRLAQVSFAGTEWLPAELGAEIDNMLLEQERDEKQLEIREDAMERLVASVEQGANAITQMEARLLEAENEFQALVVRRDQAENENELLDLVVAAGRRGNSAAAHIGSNLQDLRGDVEEMEARNEARRTTVPAADPGYGRLSQAYNRLDRLKVLHEKRQAEVQASSTDSSAPVAGNAAAGENHPESVAATPAGKGDVVIVIKDSQLQPEPAAATTATVETTEESVDE